MRAPTSVPSSEMLPKEVRHRNVSNNSTDWNIELYAWPDSTCTRVNTCGCTGPVKWDWDQNPNQFFIYNFNQPVLRQEDPNSLGSTCQPAKKHHLSHSSGPMLIPNPLAVRQVYDFLIQTRGTVPGWIYLVCKHYLVLVARCCCNSSAGSVGLGLSEFVR